MIEDLRIEEIGAQDSAVVRGHCAPEDIGRFVGAAYEEVMAALDAQGLARPALRCAGT